MQHGLAHSVALNFENANGCLTGLALQFKCLLQLGECGLGFVQVLLSLLRIDARQQLDFFHFELGLGKAVFGLLHFGFVFGARGVFLGLRFNHLLIQVVGLRLLIDIVAQLRLAIELDKQVAFFYPASARNELGNGERPHLLTGNERSHNGARLNSAVMPFSSTV